MNQFVHIMNPRHLFFFALLFLSGCSVNKARIDDSLKVHFDEYKMEGCFTFMNNKTGKVTVYNLALDTLRTLPAETFDVAASLIGLETGRASDEKMRLNIDTASEQIKNSSPSLEEAFRSGINPYFRELVRRIGKDTLRLWIDSLHYGNQSIGEKPDSSWLNNELAISPDEQLGLMKRLYFDQLPFQKRTQQLVRDMMIRENDTRYTLAYKTGYGQDKQNKPVGWVTGWIEENKHPYFFTLLMKPGKTLTDSNATGLELLKKILSQYGFFKGNM